MKRYDYYSCEDEPTRWKSISFKSAFIIVVVIHVAAFTLISFSGKKKIKSKDTITQAEHVIKPVVERYSAHRPVAKTKVTANLIAKVPKPTPTPTPKYSPPKQIMIAKLPSEKELPKSDPTPTIDKPTLKKDLPKAAVVEELPKVVPVPIEQPLRKVAIREVVPPAPRQIEANLIKPQIYVLTSGDNLYAVCRKLNVSFNDLVALNNIKDVRDLYAGLTLKIPQ